METKTNFSETMVVLQAYSNTTQAEIAKSILESAGILCVLHGEYMSTIYTIGAFPVRLMVRPEDLEEAQRLLTERIE